MTGYDSTTALIVVDVQNDFAHPLGNLHVPGAELVLAAVNSEVERAVEGGALVVYTQDWHPPTTPHFAKDGGIWPVHCVEHTWGAELHAGLLVRGDAIKKGTAGEDGYSGFSVRDPVTSDISRTALDEMLRSRGVSRVVVVGLATDYCVKETALDALDLGYETHLVGGARWAVELEEGDGAEALAEIRAVGGRVLPARGRWVDDESASLVTDLYELTMAAAFFREGFTGRATFDLFTRRLPASRNFLVVAGLDDALAFLEQVRFDAAALAYLESLDMFPGGFLEYLADFRFTGEVWAIPEGEVAFAGEPLLAVTAPLIEAQIVETFLLNTIGFQTMIASKAARVALAAGDRSFIDFSARRDHGADAALKGARAAFIGGAAATSLVLAGAAYGIPLSGTMAHSYVMAHTDEAEAFREFGRAFPGRAVMVIDTYDTEQGARIASRVANELSREGIAVRGVRLDSGDLGDLARRVRRILDEGGQPDMQVVASGDLDESRIALLVGEGAPIDAFGVGTALGTSADAPNLDVVYKLAASDSGYRPKLSPGKATLPGRKQVYRRDDHDMLALADESVQPGRPLLVPVMRDGVRLNDPPPPADIRAGARAAIEALPAPLRSLDPAEPPWPVVLAPGLDSLRSRLVAEEKAPS